MSAAPAPHRFPRCQGTRHCETPAAQACRKCRLPLCPEHVKGVMCGGTKGGHEMADVKPPQPNYSGGPKPDAKAHALRLRLYREGLTDADIANGSGCTRGAIMQWRAKHALPVNPAMRGARPQLATEAHKPEPLPAATLREGGLPNLTRAEWAQAARLFDAVAFVCRRAAATP